MENSRPPGKSTYNTQPIIKILAMNARFLGKIPLASAPENGRRSLTRISFLLPPFSPNRNMGYPRLGNPIINARTRDAASRNAAAFVWMELAPLFTHVQHTNKSYNATM
jgi:hypothetical protein